MMMRTGPLAETNWEEVSETAFDGDTSYNSTSTLGDEDLFNMGTLDAVIDEIVAVQIVGGYREADAGAHTFTQQLKIGGVDNAGAVKRWRRVINSSRTCSRSTRPRA